MHRDIFVIWALAVVGITVLSAVVALAYAGAQYALLMLNVGQ